MLKVEHGEHELSVTSKQSRALLVMLSLRPGEVISSDRLVAEMWVGEDILNSRNALQAVVSRLRRTLKEVKSDSPVLETVGQGYRLHIPRFQVDVFEFDARVQRAITLQHTSPHDAAELLETALGLWRGEPLDGLTDLPLLWAEHTRLVEAHLSASELLAEVRLAAGEVRKALTLLRPLSEAHVGRERLSELLMVALYLEGRQLEALDLFARIRRRLRAEIGVEPGHGLRRVHQAILNHDPALESLPRRGNLLSPVAELSAPGLALSRR